MSPDPRPPKDPAADEAWLKTHLDGLEPHAPRYLTWGNVVVVLLGFALAFWLAAFHLAQP